MSTNAKATGYLDLNINGFDQAIKTAKNLMIGLAGTFAAYKVGSFFKDGIKDAINFGKEMQSASRAMGGFDPGALMLVQKSLEKVGMGAEEARGHIADFISQGRNISEMFGGADEYSRALKSAAADYGPIASVLSKAGEKLQTIWNTLESIASRTQEFFLSMTAEFVNPLQVALDYLNSIHLDKVGRDFGDALAKASNTLLGLFKNGDIWNVIKAGVNIAFFGGIDTLMTGFQKAVEFLGTAMKKIMENVGKSIDLQKIGIVFKTLFDGIGYSIGAKILEAMSNIPGLGKLAESAKGQRQSAGTNFEIASAGMKSVDLGQGMADLDLAGVFKSAKEAADKIRFGESEFGKKAEENWKSLSDKLKLAEETGIKMGEESRAKHAGDEAGSKKALTSFSGSSSKVIADSLAKVGGGGGYLRQGMTLQERSAMQTAMATKQTAETLQAMHSESKQRPNRPATLPR